MGLGALLSAYFERLRGHQWLVVYGTWPESCHIPISPRETLAVYLRRISLPGEADICGSRAGMEET